MGISLLSLWLTLLWYPWPCSLKTKMFKSKSNLKHFINLLNFFLKNYFFCRKSILDSADGPWLKSIFFYSNGFLFWLRKKIMEHLSVLADIYSTHQGRELPVLQVLLERSVNYCTCIPVHMRIVLFNISAIPRSNAILMLILPL